MVETGVSVGVSIPCYFYKNHTFDNRLGGLKFPNAIANNFLGDERTGKGEPLCVVVVVVVIQVVL